MALTPSEAIPIPGRAPLAWVQPMLNALGLVNFDPASGVGNTTVADWQVEDASSGRVIQLVMRFNW